MEHDDRLEDKGIGPIDEGFRGHPKGLMTLFFSEMWERFCYYGMRVLLTLYLVKSLMKGDSDAALIYGAYTGLVYAAPILGGRMADQFLGYRWAIIFGGILMAIGEFFILGGTEDMLLVGMGALIIGNGYFKANISTVVGKLYRDGDPRRDSGFTIFYIGINVGAFLATSLVAYVGEVIGYRYGFGLAGIGMLLGILIFYFGRNTYQAADGLDVTEKGKKKVFGPINAATGISILSLLGIPLCFFLIRNNGYLDFIFIGLFLWVAYSLISAGIKEGVIWRDRMIALIIFLLINIVFWAFFEQAGTSLTLFADRCVNREIFGWTMPASMTQVFNPLFILIFGSFFSAMWLKLTRIGKNPSIPYKFALGIFQLGLGFFVAYLGFTMETDFKVPLLTLVFLYMLHTTGELFLSPIGLSMVTKLAPKKMTGTAMGAWFLGFAIANFLGGKIATLTGDGHGDKPNKTKFTEASSLEEAISLSSGDTYDLNQFPKFGDFKKNANFDVISTNMDVGQYQLVEDWVNMREAVLDNASLNDWKESKSSLYKWEESSKPGSWLNPEAWKTLYDRVKAVVDRDEADIEAQKISKDDVMSLGFWKYYRKDISKNISEDISLKDAIAKNELIVREQGLNKYVTVFNWIGLILVCFSLLIALFNKPLKKLMHGVE